MKKTDPVYKPMLANKLNFPEGIEAAIIYDCEIAGGYRLYLDINKAIKEAEDFRKLKMPYWLFLNWDEVVNCMYDQEQQNRQFCQIVDLMTWRMVPEKPGAELPPQMEIEF